MLIQVLRSIYKKKFKEYLNVRFYPDLISISKEEKNELKINN